MFAQVSGLRTGELVHVIADAHIYDRHIPLVEKILGRPQFEAPKLIMDENQKDFYGFTADSFALKDYLFNKFEEMIPVAI